MPQSSPAQERIKVLWLIKGLGPGGAEQLLLLSARVADHGAFDYRVAYLRPDKTHLIPEFQALGLTPIRLGSQHTGRLGWLADLRSLLADVDVLHSHSPVLASVARLLTLTFPPRKRAARVATEHNEWTSHRLPTRLANGITGFLDAHNWAVSDQVLATMWRLRRKRSEVLIHGIDTEAEVHTRARAEVRAELGVPEDAVLSITVANLRKNKDYPNLLRAAKTALATEPRLRFIAVGQGPLETELRALHAELGLGDRFQLLGYRRDIPDLMAAADFFTLGSAHEGLPVAIMEAFAAGLPVVATTVGGVPGQVIHGQHGLLVPPHDDQALAEVLVQLASDDAGRVKMAEAARVRAKDFDIRRAVTEQQRVYAELAG